MTFEMLNMHIKALKLAKVIFHTDMAHCFLPFPATVDESPDVYPLVHNIWIVLLSMHPAISIAA